MGTDDASILDGASGIAVGVIGGAAVVSTGYAVSNNVTNDTPKKVVEAVKDIAKGNIRGKDLEGKKVAFNKSTWEGLKENGLAEQDKDGKWIITGDKKKVQSYLSSNQPSSAGTDQKIQPTASKAPITNPINTDITSPSNNNSPKTGDMGNYNTSSAKNKLPTIKSSKEALKTLAKTSNTDLGKQVLTQEATQAKSSAMAELKDATASGDKEAIHTAENKVASANKVLEGIKNGEVFTKDLKNAGIKTPHLKIDTSGKYPKSVVDFDGIGETTRVKEEVRHHSDIAAKRASLQEAKIARADANGKASDARYEADLGLVQRGRRRCERMFAKFFVTKSNILYYFFEMYLFFFGIGDFQFT
jgi:hypothetical protein